jgi:uncharacterized coiled-coil DUF342 family protein
VSEASLKSTETKSKRELLNELREQKKDLLAEVRELKKERDQYQQERDEKNKAMKELMAEAKTLKEQRDKINEEVQLKKALREMSREDADKIFKKLQEMEEEIETIGVDSKQPRGGGRKKTHTLSRKISELEVELETTPNLSPQKEREIVAQIDKLTEEVANLAIATEKRDELKLIQQKLRAHRNNAKNHHLEVKKLAEDSQTFHDQMIEKIAEAKKIRSEADKKHKLAVQQTKVVKEVELKIKKVINDADTIRKELGEETSQEIHKRRKEEEKVKQKEAKKQADDIKEKLESGERLGFDEFKVLLNQGKFFDKDEKEKSEK